MDPLSIAASIAGLLTLAGTVVSKGYAILSAIPKADDLQALVNTTAAFSGILNGVKNHLGGTRSGRGIPSLERDAFDTTIIGCKGALESMVTVLDNVARASVVTMLVKITGWTEKIRELGARIEGYKSFFILCLQIQSSVESSKTNQLTNEMYHILKGVQSSQQAIQDESEKAALVQTKERIVGWLGNTTENAHDDITASRGVDTPTWLLDRLEFGQWVSDESSAFWLCGTQGTGKSVITSSVIETIQRFEQDSTTVVAYHYCRFSDATANTSEKLMAALICHIVKSSDSYQPPPSLVKLCEKWRSRARLPPVKELQPALEECLQSVERVYIVIDGLDEIRDRRPIIKLLHKLRSSQQNDHACKIFVSSRPDSNFEQVFQDWEYNVRITSKDIESDLEEFVEEKISQMRLDDEEADALSRELVGRADGMFLWAVCQLDRLSRVRTAISGDMIKALPPGLSETFAAQLTKLEDDDLTLALDTLRIVMYSKRQLDLTELVEVLAIKGDVKNHDQLRRNLLRRPADVFEICGCLITQSRSTGKIAIAHYSVYEFLSSPQLGSGMENRFFLDSAAASLKLTTACVTYLSMENFNDKSFSDSVSIVLDDLEQDTAPQIFSDSPFLDYAATFWWQHLRELTAVDFQKVWLLLRLFVATQRNNFNSWVMVGRYLTDGYRYPEGAQAIHIAALHGLTDLAKRLLSIGSNSLQLVTKDGRTPLHIAVENAQYDIVTILAISQQISGALNTRDQYNRLPLQIAVEAGDAAITRVLIQFGANVDAEASTPSQSPISIAISNKWEDLAPLFSVKTNGEGSLGHRRTLMHVAAQCGSMVWVKELSIRHKHLILVEDQDKWMPIHFAAESGIVEIVQFFLDNESSIMPKDVNGWTPLHSAIKHNNLKCALLLLKTAAAKPPTPPKPSPVQDLPDSTRLPSSSLLQTPSASKYGRYAGDAPRARGSSSTPARGTEPVRPEHTVSTPLFIAVSESNKDAVQLLLNHVRQLPELDEAEIQKCLDSALTKSPTNPAIIASLIGKVAIYSAIQTLNKLATVSPETAGLLRLTWDVSFVQEKLLPEAINWKELEVALFLAHNWPLTFGPDSGALLHKLLDDRRVGMFHGWKAGMELIRVLVEKGAPLAALNFNRQTLLCVSILRAAPDVAELLIQLGALDDPDCSDRKTSLLTLAQSQIFEFSEAKKLGMLLVKSGVDIAATNLQGRGVCYHAVDARNDGLLAWLLEEGARPDLPDNHGNIAIHEAVRHLWIPGARLLLTYVRDRMEPKKQIAVFGYSNWADSIFTFTASRGPLELLNLVMRTENSVFRSVMRTMAEPERATLLKQRGVLYTEALCSSIQEGNLHKITTILLQMDDVSSATSRGFTPLHIAAREGRAVIMLLEKGADINAKVPHTGKTAADICYDQDDIATLAVLVERGEEPREEYMSLALQRDDFTLATALVGKGLLITSEHLEMATTLRLSVPMMRLMLDHGAKLQPKNLETAVRMSDVELLRQVLQRYPDDTESQISALLTARVTKKDELVSVLRDHTSTKLLARIDQVPDGAGTLLSRAANARRPDLMKAILALHGAGPDILEASERGQERPLLTAMRTYHWASAELLIRCGADTTGLLAWASSRGVSVWSQDRIQALKAQGPWGL